MYERFYGFRERPFDLTPNPRFLFLTARHREALSTIQYGLSSRTGITLVIGEAGTGKTTLIRAALDDLRRPEHRFVYLTNPTLTRAEFYELLATAFGLGASAATSKAQFLTELEPSILERRRRGGLSALVIDEAQSLPAGLLEEVRLLANIETSDEKLLPLLLVGQPEIAQRLEEEAWQPLKQRVSLRAEIGRLDIRETAAYIAGRIRIAGGDVTQIFTRDAVGVIFQHSRGIPRVVSVICDNALVSGFASGARPITRQVVLEVCRDFRFASELPLAPEADATAQPIPPPVEAGTPAGEETAAADGAGRRGGLASPDAGHRAAGGGHRPSGGPGRPSGAATGALVSRRAGDQVARQVPVNNRKAGAEPTLVVTRPEADSLRSQRLNVPLARLHPAPTPDGKSRPRASAAPAPAPEAAPLAKADAPARAAESGGRGEVLFSSFQRKRRFWFF